MLWAVIMAGGVGSRFWPLSRKNLPKQLLPIVTRKSMLEETVKRLSPLVPPSRILIITNDSQKKLISKLRTGVPRENVIAEPAGRNTAPCLALAALHIEARDPHAVFAALPADHMIRNKAVFHRNLKAAALLAEEGEHVVFGIPPAVPHTGYGYIACKGKGAPRGGAQIYQGWTFTEKPPLWQAKAFVRSRKYFWNSGMFVWKLSTFLCSIERLFPELGRHLNPLRTAIRKKKTLAAIFRKLPAVSIDYGLMEKLKEFSMVKAEFDWSDVGSWAEIDKWQERDKHGNAVAGHVLAVDSSDNIVRSDGRLVAILGVKDMIVVDAGDAVLVCPKSKAQEIRKIVSELDRRKLHSYL